ncbi:MAG: M56 family metallopeptidase [Myxococcota bacterium]
MSGHLASLAALSGLWLLLALLAAIATPLVWPLAQRLVRDRGADAHARVAWLAAVAPVLLPTILVGLCALPGIAGALFGPGDHCAAHGDHPHFCAIHATRALPASSALLLLALAPVGLPLLVGLVRDLRRGRRESRWLRQRQLDSPSPGLHRLDSALPIALSHGLRRPEIWISRSLDAALTPAERAVVLAHERAHVARRDPARLALAALASRLHFPVFRDRVLSALRLAAEQACDADAARAVGDPLRVAATLLRVERLLQGTPSDLRFAAPLLDASLPARIEALVASDAEATARGATYGTDPARNSASDPRSPHRPSPFPSPSPSPFPSAHTASPVSPPAASPTRRNRAGWILGAIALAFAVARPLHHLAEHALDAVLRSMVGLGALF